jgi:hypothetical protein
VKQIENSLVSDYLTRQREIEEQLRTCSEPFLEQIDRLLTEFGVTSFDNGNFTSTFVSAMSAEKKEYSD